MNNDTMNQEEQDKRSWSPSDQYSRVPCPHCGKLIGDIAELEWSNWGLQDNGPYLGDSEVIATNCPHCEEDILIHEVNHSVYQVTKDGPSGLLARSPIAPLITVRGREFLIWSGLAAVVLCIVLLDSCVLRP